MTLRVRQCGWRRARNGVFLCVALAGCAGSSSASAKIAVMPTTGLADRARTILVTGGRPTQRVTVNARSIGADAIWSATASFRASQRGVINLADSAPTSGSYRGVSEMGLFWSQHRVSSKPDASGPFSRSRIPFTAMAVPAVVVVASHLSGHLTPAPGARFPRKTGKT
jgi:Acyl-CoA thioester hydrolase/BAAT N-terminal region